MKLSGEQALSTRVAPPNLVRRPDRRQPEGDPQHNLIHQQRAKHPDLVCPEIARHPRVLQVCEAHRETRLTLGTDG
jgi:hypothetical protein